MPVLGYLLHTCNQKYTDPVVWRWKIFCWSVAGNKLARLSSVLKHACFYEATETTFTLLFVFMPERVVMADTGGRADVRQLACWDCRFESHQGMDVCV